jgi:antitoxin HicB
MSYLTIISAGPNNWNALVPELHCVVTGKDRQAVIARSRESIAVALGDRADQAAGITSTIANIEQVHPAIRAEIPEDAEVVFLEPAAFNPVSQEIAAALVVARITQAELARRLETSPAAVSRLVNPFYWGHSLALLRRIAEALQAELTVHMRVPELVA